jgi:hypothetical protein
MHSTALSPPNNDYRIQVVTASSSDKSTQHKFVPVDLLVNNWGTRVTLFNTERENDFKNPNFDRGERDIFRASTHVAHRTNHRSGKAAHHAKVFFQSTQF